MSRHDILMTVSLGTYGRFGFPAAGVVGTSAMMASSMPNNPAQQTTKCAKCGCPNGWHALDICGEDFDMIVEMNRNPSPQTPLMADAAKRHASRAKEMNRG